MHTVLVISSGIFHPSLPGRLALWRGLRALPGVTLRHATSVEVLARADLPRPDALVLFIHGKTISEPALDALDRFVRGGGGILAVHSATASFKETPRYTAILGGRFTGHPPVQPLEVRPAGARGVSGAASADEIFGPVAPFTVTDEAYRHELAGDIRVHFTARLLRRAASAPPVEAARTARTQSPTAPTEDELPIVWTRCHGLGRLCYVGWGHRSASLRHPSAVRILQAGLAWICRGGEDGAR